MNFYDACSVNVMSSSKRYTALPASANTDPAALTLAKVNYVFPIVIRKLILSLPWFSFFGGHHIPVSHIPSIYRPAL